MSKPIASAVSCHAFNKTGDLCALSPNTNEVIIYSTEGSEDTDKWVSKYILNEHGGTVSGIDWHHETNQIVTCGHDRNAYVWKYEEKSDVWRPILVVLRINRAATACKWSPLGNKFAVTSGAKTAAVCSYEPSNDWYVSKMLKKHKSTVLSCAWSPNNRFLITGSSDLKCRIFSAYLKKLDSSDDDGFGAIFPDQFKFGEVLAEFSQSHSWIHSVAWAPSGNRVAWAGHDSTILFAELAPGGAHVVTSACSPDLPFLDIDFLSDTSLVAVGFSCNPILYSFSDNSWTLNQSLDKLGKGDEKAAAGPKSAFHGARAVWQASTDKGHKIGADASAAASKETVLATRHQNTIMKIWKNKRGLVTTSSVDGRILYWDLAKCGVDLSALKI